MEYYIWIRQNTVAQYISTLSLMNLCEGTERTPGAQVGMRWWEQVNIDLVGGKGDIGGGGGEVGHFYGIQRLWSPPRDGDLHPIPGG